jgi:phenylacetate-CoA ligase
VAEQANQNGFSLNSSSVTKLICIGEAIRDKNFELTNMGRHLSEQWCAQLYSTYGLTEIATAFCECQYGAGGHFHPELVYIEVLDDDGNNVADGEVGELTATTIGVEAMPVLRFRTGDCSFINRSRCACGMETWRVGPILVRKKQMMKLKGTTVYPTAVQQVLENIDGITGYVMIARSDELLSDELEILVSVKDMFAGEIKNIVTQHCQSQLKVKPNVRVVDLKKIEGLQDSGMKRKRVLFIDERKR